jgi:AcrR family transcriptional regulator
VAKSSRGPGRPRSTTAGNTILDATLALLGEGGFQALSMDAVAARAGVSKATIYRRWSSREAMVADAVLRLSRTVPTPDTGSIHGDLLAILQGLAAILATPQSTRLVSGLLARAAVDARLGRALREGFLAERRASARKVFERAIARGELRADLDLELAIDLAAAPLYYRCLVSAAPLDDAYIHRLTETILRALEAPDRERREAAR